MCTAIAFGEKNRYFGRTLDYDVTFGEYVAVTPRNFCFSFRFLPDMKNHAAMIGTAAVIDGYPLYYEATNEHGLSMAGLNFAGNCHFCDCVLDMRDNVCQFELIPYILGRCRTVAQARRIFDRINIVNEPFLQELPPAQLHWIIADAAECAVLEVTRDGTAVYDDPYGVLTNNPPFPFHRHNLCLYMSLSAHDREQGFCHGLERDVFCRGMGAYGLPGDWTSPSRFVRAAYVRANAVTELCEQEGVQAHAQKGREKSRERAELSEKDHSTGADGNACAAGVNQFFHILGTVEMVRGCVGTENGARAQGAFEYTQYSCCCDTARGVYYFKSYADTSLHRVDMYCHELNSKELVAVPHRDCPMI